MKLNLVPFLICFLISSLIAYGYYAIDLSIMRKEDFKIAITLISFLFGLTTLSFCFGVSFTLPRTGTVIKTFSFVSFIIGFIFIFLMNTFLTSIPILIIVSGISILIYTLITYFIYKAAQ